MELNVPLEDPLPARNGNLGGISADLCNGGEMDIDSDELQMHLAEERLKFLVVIDEAMRRYSEVLPLLWASANHGEAVAAIRSLLDVDAIRAQAVLDLQWGRLTVPERMAVSEERAKLQALVERGRPTDGDR